MIDPCLAVYGVSSTSVVVLAASVLHAVTLWGFCLLFLLLDRFPSCRHHRLQRPKLEHLRPDSPKNVALDAVAFREQLLGTFVVVPLGVLLLTPVLAWRGNTICEDENSSTKTGLILHVVGMVCGCDLIFYWTHRLLHENKWLYRNVHKQHHEYKATNVWASEYFGVVDMVLNILPGVIPAVVFGSSFRSLLWFTALRQFQTVQSHAGYNLPWYLDPCNLFDGARRHDYHHSHNIGCYGDWFPFWDRTCGTDRSYRTYLAQKEQTEGKAK